LFNKDLYNDNDFHLVYRLTNKLNKKGLTTRPFLLI